MESLVVVDTLVDFLAEGFLKARRQTFTASINRAIALASETTSTYMGYNSEQ